MLGTYVPMLRILLTGAIFFVIPSDGFGQTREEAEKELQQEVKLEKQIATLKGWRVGALNSLNSQTRICILLKGDTNCPGGLCTKIRWL